MYQFTLTLRRGAMGTRLMREAASRLGANITPNDAGSGVSAFKALEGLGLELERRRVPVDVIVVDKISRTPTDT